MGEQSHAARRAFWVALPVAAAAIGLLFLLLAPGRDAAARESSSAVAFLLAGVGTGLACARRARLSHGRRRRSWLLFTAGAGVAVVANLLGSADVAAGTFEPSVVTDAGLSLALLLAIAGLATFPGAARRGPEQLMAVVDGLVAGGGVLAIAAVLVYPELLATLPAAPLQLVPALLIPVLDVVLVTLALVCLMRTTPVDRWWMGLVAIGFVLYGAADLAYAVQVAQGEFVFGTRLDLGWIGGYLLVLLAALLPPGPDEDDASAHASEALGSVVVFTVLLVAGAVQVVGGGPVTGPLAVLWLLLVLLAGWRQWLLGRANAALRDGLRARVADQTADLRRLVSEIEQLLDSVGDGIYGVDLAGRITFANPSAARALGFRSRDLLGRDAHRLFHHDHDHDDCYVAHVVASGTPVSEVEDTYSRMVGPDFKVEITVNPVRESPDAEPRGAVVVFRDVTQRREVERMKNEFLSVVSHELRTPLTSIRGSLGLLAGGALGELPVKAATMVGVAAESSERLTRLINDLLDMERIGAGGRALRLSGFDARAVVTAAVDQIQGAAAPLGVSVEVGPCHGRVHGDEDQVVQTLTNLLGNALKFSERGGTVVASASAEDTHVVFRVRDEGRGIPSDQLALVFEPFAQVDSSDTREKGGTGLGLTISRAIVERHGGRIWAESREGRGTTMLFTIPADLDPLLLEAARP